VDAFVAEVAPTVPVWLGRGQCLEQHGAGEPYLPLLEALGRWGRGPDGQQLAAVLRQQAPSWLVQLPARNRSGCENLSLVVTSLSAVPCRHGNTGGIII
jgi:hypothetical protein